MAGISAAAWASYATAAAAVVGAAVSIDNSQDQKKQFKKRLAFDQMDRDKKSVSEADLAERDRLKRARASSLGREGTILGGAGAQNNSYSGKTLLGQ